MKLTWKGGIDEINMGLGVQTKFTWGWGYRRNLHRVGDTDEVYMGLGIPVRY